ncbi:MAG: heavy metal transporter [Desulfobacterales bacterium CG23_combo_of_CG06-09_8_20_14_all_51_8]|nr:MAG: heavy metal transporter [Desulfobacterales bacterium CG23_combo_of_CG06-09_8_20_14_all_51_8]
MNKTFHIPNITCDHCVKTICNELLELEAVRTVKGDADQKTITVDWDAPVTEGKILKVLQSITYPAE